MTHSCHDAMYHTQWATSSICNCIVHQVDITSPSRVNVYSCLVCILSTERWQVQFITSLLSMHVTVPGNRMNEMASWLNIQANLFCDMLKWDAPARLHT